MKRIEYRTNSGELAVLEVPDGYEGRDEIQVTGNDRGMWYTATFYKVRS